MPVFDVDILSFISQFPIDKIAWVDSISITNPGPTYANEDVQRARIVTGQKAHGVGRPCFIRARYRIDGGVWQDMGTVLTYTFSIPSVGVVLPGRLSQISIGCDASNVYFRTANGHHSNASGGPAPPYSYTSYSHTFDIQYVLYEMT